MPTIQEQIDLRFARELTACRRIRDLAAALRVRNQSKIVYKPSVVSTRAVLGLEAKARKTYSAAGILVSQGFGEDGIILARSLTNITIDLAYICSGESEARALRWLAQGLVSRREFAKKAGRVVADETTTNWSEMEGLAKEWRDVKIWKRALDANLQSFYDTAYRHGSIFEHSDSWAALGYLDFTDDKQTVLIQTEPSLHNIDLALVGSAFAFAQTWQTAGTYWGFDFGNSIEEMDSIVASGFEPRAGSVGLSSRRPVA